MTGEACLSRTAPPLALNPAAAMFALGRSAERRYLIRMSAVLHEPVEPGLLQAALERPARRYPYFFVCLNVEGGPPCRRSGCRAPAGAAEACAVLSFAAGRACAV